MNTRGFDHTEVYAVLVLIYFRELLTLGLLNLYHSFTLSVNHKSITLDDHNVVARNHNVYNHQFINGILCCGMSYHICHGLSHMSAAVCVPNGHVTLWDVIDFHG